jgi:hypothetical protein
VTGYDVDCDDVRVEAGDCDDDSAPVFPGAPELCDGFDSDCDGLMPADELDEDGDGFAPCDGD